MQKGYPREWFTDDCQVSIDQKGLSCSSCKLVLRDAVQAYTCGSRFCKICYEGLFRNVPPGPVTCPQCEHDDDADAEDSLHLAPNEFQPDNFCRNQVKHLTARCEYYEQGCDWTGAVIHYEQHLHSHDDAVCCVCGQEFSNVLEHRRHLMIGCPKAVKAPVVQQPCSACENDNVLGPDHIVFLCSEAQSLRVAVEHITARDHGEGNSLPLSTPPVNPRDVPESPAVVQPDQYETLANKYKANTALITVLYNEVKTCSHKLISMDNESVNSGVTDLRQRVTVLQKIATDAKSKWEAIERRLLDGAMPNTSGCLMWLIDNIEQRMEEARSGNAPALYSSPFFTSDAGYKACARLYLNGDGAGKDSHVSLYFALMKGRFDAILPWPFTHQVTMLLLDQSGQGCHVQEKFRPDRLSSSFQQPRSEMNVTTGCPRFISKTELERRKTLYMKENTMFIQIIVE